jgi:CheY-like chemotaxis protein
MRPLVTNSAIQLTIDEESVDPSVVMMTDEGLVSQILRNLVANALKFTEQGEVRVDIDARACPTGRIAFTVQDTGIGISPEDQERVFEEFVQIDGPLQRQRKGTGLGLPLCRRLAGLLGGSIALTSTVGVGSTFRVELPCEIQSPDLHPEETGRSPTRQETPTVKTPQLLLIDDDDAWRYLARQALSKLGVDVLEASNGTDGLELAKQHRPSAILLDLLMPGLTGYQVLKALQESSETRGIPVIIWTSEDIEATDDPRLTGMIHSLIRKPADGQGPALGEIEEALRSAGALHQESAR